MTTLPIGQRPPRVCVVVGASSGIGRATAHELARAGDHLVLVARAEGPLSDTAAECRALGASRARAITVDVTVESEVEQLVAEVLAEHTVVDVWVHAAAVMAYGSFVDTPSEVFRRVVETELFGTVHAARAVLPAMTAQGHGVLVVVNSLLGQIATPWMSAYVTSKWALRGFVRSLQIELMDQPDVHVVSVSPGGVNTPIYTQGANVVGREPRPPVPVDPPEKVAARIVASIDRPRPERGVGLLNPVIRLGFTVLPGVYDRLVGPLMRRLSFTDEVRPATDGNVEAPVPELEAVHGSWPDRWR